MKRFPTSRKRISSLHYLCLKSEIPEGHSKVFSISVQEFQQDVAVFNIRGNFHAISNACAHKGGPLSQRKLEKTIVTRPLHGWKYDVRNGKPPHEGGDSVNSFKINVVRNKLYLDDDCISCYQLRGTNT